MVENAIFFFQCIENEISLEERERVQKRKRHPHKEAKIKKLNSKKINYATMHVNLFVCHIMTLDEINHKQSTKRMPKT